MRGNFLERLEATLEAVVEDMEPEEVFGTIKKQ